MSDNNTTPKQENTSQYTAYQHIDDEISLVDLVKTLIRHRRWFFATFLLVAFLSIIYAFAQSGLASRVDQSALADKLAPDDKPGTLTFSSFLSLGYKTPDHYLEPMASVEAQILGAYYPLLIEANPGFANYKVEVEYTTRRDLRADEGSNLMTITTRALAQQRQEVMDLHQQLLMPLINQHNQLVSNLNQQQSDAASEQAYVRALPSRLVALAVPSQTSQATVSSESNRPKPALIVVLGIILGAMLGIFAALFAEFIIKVRQSLKDDALGS